MTDRDDTRTGLRARAAAMTIEAVDPANPVAREAMRYNDNPCATRFFRKPLS